MSLSLHKIVSISLIVLLTAACSGKGNRYKREVNGNDSYLKTPALKALISPEGVQIPIPTPTYNINLMDESDHVGKALDIRPPMQAIAPMEYAQSDYKEGTAILITRLNTYSWQHVIAALNADGIPYTQTGATSVNVANYSWSEDDDEMHSGYVASYQISLDTKNNRDVLSVNLLNLHYNNEPVTERLEIKRYTINMYNRIVLNLAGLTQKPVAKDEVLATTADIDE